MTLLVGAGFGVVVVMLNHAEPTLLRPLSLVSGGGAGWATLGFAGESAIYLTGFEWLSPLERAVRLTIIGGTLAVVAVMLGRKLSGSKAA